ncbi:MAG: TonB-dependent receptor [Hyphomicrobiaceae bacterium]|nr:MAG: TonB-dependent receptor [Hyphomicrobiaceae bacterium]
MSSIRFPSAAAGALAAAVSLSAPALAQVQLQGIIIEGATLQGTPIAPEDQGSAVTILTQEELRAQQVRHAADALRSLPGVSVSRTGSYAGLTQVRIRGSEANHVLVLIDGIEANPAVTGEFDFSHLLVEDIERIEIIRGPQSGLYGSTAIGGVINIVTKKGQGPLALTLKGEYGSFNTRDGFASLSAGTSAVWFRLSYNERLSEGFNIAPFGEEKDGSEVRSFSLRAGGKANENLSFEVNLRNVDKKGDRDGEGGLPGQLATQVDTLSHFASTLWLASIEGTWKSLDGVWTHRLKVTDNRTTLSDTDVSTFGSFLSINTSEITTVREASTVRLDAPAILHSRHYLTGLVEMSRETFTNETDDAVEHGRRRSSFAGEWRGEFANRLFLSATVRHDDNDTFADFTTWRSAASLKIKELGLRPHASVGTGVKFPTMFEQFGSIPTIFVPNPALLPEESFGWDAGIELALAGGAYLVDVTYFDTDLKNEIATVFLPGFLSTVINRDGISHRRGVEVAAKAKVTKALGLGLSFTYLDATEPDGTQEIRRPRYLGRGDLTYRFADDKAKLHLAAIYNGKAEDIAFRLPFFISERVTLGDYWLVSAAVSYELTPDVEVFGRVENLFDQHYQEVYGFETAGIAAYAGVRVKLGLAGEKTKN